MAQSHIQPIIDAGVGNAAGGFLVWAPAPLRVVEPDQRPWSKSADRRAAEPGEVRDGATSAPSVLAVIIIGLSSIGAIIYEVMKRREEAKTERDKENTMLAVREAALVAEDLGRALVPEGCHSRRSRGKAWDDPSGGRYAGIGGFCTPTPDPEPLCPPSAVLLKALLECMAHPPADLDCPALYPLTAIG
jgi:hypothetical protein